MRTRGHDSRVRIIRPIYPPPGWPEPGERSVVTIEIVPTEQGCTLRLTHEMEARWIDYADQKTAAWTRMTTHIDKLTSPPGG